MNTKIKSKIENMLTDEFSCTLEDLNGKDTVHTVKPDTSKPHLKMLAYRNCVIICTSEGISERMQKLLKGKSRDEIFECPFVYGQTIHYVPGDDMPNRSTMPSDYRCEVLFGEEILSLRGLDGFDNSLAFDENGATSAKAVCIAKEGGQDWEIIGAAGASETSPDGVWEVGVDVREGHRNAGLATYLVSRLTEELLRRGIVPFYSASVTNVGSQMVAARCGYVPCWVDTFGTTLDGSSVYGDISLLDRDFKIRPADKEDLPRILQIYEYARKFMKETGNASQWRDSFPPERLLAEDIDAGQLYTVRDRKEGKIHGAFAFIIGEEPTYARIEGGKWLSDTQYGTLHRVAGDGNAHGIFDAIVKFVERKNSHLRVDTHEDNKVMQHLIEKNGFQKCGIIYVEDGSSRIAYEKMAGEK